MPIIVDGDGLADLLKPSLAGKRTSPRLPRLSELAREEVAEHARARSRNRGRVVALGALMVLVASAFQLGLVPLEGPHSPGALVYAARVGLAQLIAP